MRKLNIRPDTGVYGTYKRISYQPWTALAEFVDNSTQSFYDHKDELFATKYYKGLEIEITYTEDPFIGDEIVIKDNAYGMDYRDFQRAIILDRPPINTKGRNEFGMGLKAAACWFGNIWTVESTCLGSNIKYKATVDIDALVKYKNEEIDVEEEEVKRKEHYTIITIRQLNKKIKGKRIERKIHELLSSIYRCDLRTGDIKIYYNGQALVFNEVTPYVDENQKEWKKDVNFTIPYRDTELTVTGFIAVRIPGDTRNAGFTLLRRGRVIIGGPEKNYRPYEVFGASNGYPYQRLYGELNMDDWPVTQAKDAFDWSNEDLESKFIDKLIEVSADYRRFADDLRVREKVKLSDISESLTKSFNNNEHVNILEVKADPFSNTGLREDDLIEDIDDETKKTDRMSATESVGVGVEIEGNQPIIITMEYRSKKYSFTIILDDTNRISEWLKLETLDKQSNTYKLTLNTHHLFFYPFIQKKDFLVVLVKFATALIIAELNSYEIAQDGLIHPYSIRVAMGRILEDFIKNEK
jgi:hypothetical protein